MMTSELDVVFLMELVSEVVMGQAKAAVVDGAKRSGATVEKSPNDR
jgi:hypothetical protein